MIDSRFCLSVIYLPFPPLRTSVALSVILVRIPSFRERSNAPFIAPTGIDCSATMTGASALSAVSHCTVPPHIFPMAKAAPNMATIKTAQAYLNRWQKQASGPSVTKKPDCESIAASALLADSFDGSTLSNSSQMRRAVDSSPCSNLMRANKSAPEGVFNASGTDDSSCSASAYLPCEANAYARNMATSIGMFTPRRQAHLPQTQYVHAEPLPWPLLA